MRQPNIGQALQLMSVLGNNTPWETLDATLLQKAIDDPKGTGEQFTAFLNNGCRLMVGAKLHIDRSRPFNPAEFIGPNWTIWRGPTNGNGLEGEEEQDARSLALAEVDLVGGISLDATLNAGETYITSEERIHRLVAKDAIKMDTKIFQTLWENQKMIPERLKEKTNGNTTYVFVDGTTLRSPGGNRCSLCFYWHADVREWCWDCRWLGRDRGVDRLSALLASSSLG